jgi:hypothetical protein
MVRITALICGISLAFAGGAALAQSTDDQAACRGDAIKLCRSHVGKPDDMKKCLATNKAQLSEACKKVVESRGG